MRLFIQGFLTSSFLFLSFIILTAISSNKDKEFYSSTKKSGRYQYQSSLDWRKNNLSTWVDTQNGIAITTYIDDSNKSKIRISNYFDTLEQVKNNPEIEFKF